MLQTYRDGSQCLHLIHFATLTDQSVCHDSTDHSLCFQNDILPLALVEQTSAVPGRALMASDCLTKIGQPGRRTRRNEHKI